MDELRNYLNRLAPRRVASMGSPKTHCGVTWKWPASRSTSSVRKILLLASRSVGSGTC